MPRLVGINEANFVMTCGTNFEWPETLSLYMTICSHPQCLQICERIYYEQRDHLEQNIGVGIRRAKGHVSPDKSVFVVGSVSTFSEYVRHLLCL